MLQSNIKSAIKNDGGFILSSGDLRLESLLAKTFDFLQHNEVEGSEKIMDDIWNVFSFKDFIDTEERCDLYRYTVCSWAMIPTEKFEEASYLFNEDVYDFMNALTPENYYFGSSRGDGALIGWFEYEQEGYYE